MNNIKISPDMRKVDGHVGFVKDMTNQVVINNDKNAYQEYKDKKILIDTVSSLQKQMGDLITTMNSLKKDNNLG